jgi:hypothetical protein
MSRLGDGACRAAQLLAVWRIGQFDSETAAIFPPSLLPAAETTVLDHLLYTNTSWNLLEAMRLQNIRRIAFSSLDGSEKPVVLDGSEKPVVEHKGMSDPRLLAAAFSSLCHCLRAADKIEGVSDICPPRHLGLGNFPGCLQKVSTSRGHVARFPGSFQNVSNSASVPNQAKAVETGSGT